MIEEEIGPLPVHEPICLGDDRLDFLIDMEMWIWSHPHYDGSFFYSVLDRLNAINWITMAQYNAILKCYYDFKMYRTERAK